MNTFFSWAYCFYSILPLEISCLEYKILKIVFLDHSSKSPRISREILALSTNFFQISPSLLLSRKLDFYYFKFCTNHMCLTYVTQISTSQTRPVQGAYGGQGKGQRRSQEYIHGDGKDPFFILTPLWQEQGGTPLPYRSGVRPSLNRRFK